MFKYTKLQYLEIFTLRFVSLSLFLFPLLCIIISCTPPRIELHVKGSFFPSHFVILGLLLSVEGMPLENKKKKWQVSFNTA